MAALTRRTALGFLGATGLLGLAPTAFAQGVADRKFIFVLLRGAMDGLAALIPDDAAYQTLRRGLVPPATDRLPQGNEFRLHPQLANLKAEYDLGHVAFIHAASTQYQGRSHFDGQDYLETLGSSESQSGWLNRALFALGKSGLAVGHAVPLAMRGQAPVSNWSPPVFKEVDEDLLARLATLYRNDAELSEPLMLARETLSLTSDVDLKGNFRHAKSHTFALQSVGRLMGAENGPGVGMVALSGWDTHVSQTRRLELAFADLDQGLKDLKLELQAHWDQTCIVICSEFGRTAAVNGTGGTDHGTGGLVTLLGGAVKGGRIYGDWPGLDAANLYEGRDLAPANDVSAILKGVLRDHLGADRQALNTSVLPGSGRAFDGLIRT